MQSRAAIAGGSPTLRLSGLLNSRACEHGLRRGAQRTVVFQSNPFSVYLSCFVSCASPQLHGFDWEADRSLQITARRCKPVTLKGRLQRPRGGGGGGGGAAAVVAVWRRRGGGAAAVRRRCGGAEAFAA
jgi:hypothetical protein